MIKRKIRLFFVSYGNLILFFIGTFLLIVLVIQGLNNIVKKQNPKNNINITEEKIEIQKKEEQDKEEKEYISKFINYCNNNKIEEAYEMLSEKCKKEKYNNIKQFKNQYIDKVFDIYIYDYKIIKHNNQYKVNLTQDIISTGRIDSVKEEIYLIDGELEPRIYIYN